MNRLVFFLEEQLAREMLKLPRIRHIAGTWSIRKRDLEKQLAGKPRLACARHELWSCGRIKRTVSRSSAGSGFAGTLENRGWPHTFAMNWKAGTRDLNAVEQGAFAGWQPKQGSYRTPDRIANPETGICIEAHKSQVPENRLGSRASQPPPIADGNRSGFRCSSPASGEVFGYRVRD